MEGVTIKLSVEPRNIKSGVARDQLVILKNPLKCPKGVAYIHTLGTSESFKSIPAPPPEETEMETGLSQMFVGMTSV